MKSLIKRIKDALSDHAEETYAFAHHTKNSTSFHVNRRAITLGFLVLGVGFCGAKESYETGSLILRVISTVYLVAPFLVLHWYSSFMCKRFGELHKQYGDITNDLSSL